MSSAKNPYGDGDSAKQIYSIIEEHYTENNLKITRADKIMDFEGYYMYVIQENITVAEYENKNKGQIIEQVFTNGRPEYIEEQLNLENKTIIVKKFENED